MSVFVKDNLVLFLNGELKFHIKIGPGGGKMVVFTYNYQQLQTLINLKIFIKPLLGLTSVGIGLFILKIISP